MACREIRCFKGYVIKCIPNFINNIFPEYKNSDDFNAEELHECLKSYPIAEQASVIQQYNEIYIWEHSMDMREHTVLAPVDEVVYNTKTHLPKIIFPYFEPLVSSEIFYRFSDESNLLRLGYEAANHNLNFVELEDFITKSQSIAEFFDLDYDDIINNLSNIGYNKNYGFRIIDYGLKKSCYSKGFEFVFE